MPLRARTTALVFAALASVAGAGPAAAGTTTGLYVPTAPAPTTVTTTPAVGGLAIGQTIRVGLSTQTFDAVSPSRHYASYRMSTGSCHFTDIGSGKAPLFAVKGTTFVGVWSLGCSTTVGSWWK